MAQLEVLASVAVSALVLAACGSDSSSSTPTVDAPAAVADAPAAIDAYVPAVDAPPGTYDFSCYQNTAPTTAAATVTLAGTVQEVVLSGGGATVQAAANATVDICKGNCTGPDKLDTQGPTASTGTFTSAALTTGGAPLDGYLRVTKTGNWTSLIYPASPITASLPDVPVFMFSNSVIFGLSFAGIATQQSGKAIVGMLVTDCADQPVAGATVSVTQNGMAVGDAPYDASTLDAAAAGTYIVFNVPAGANTVVSATYEGMTFRAHTVAAVGDTTTMTQIKPGF